MTASLVVMYRLQYSGEHLKTRARKKAKLSNVESAEVLGGSEVGGQGAHIYVKISG